MNLQPATETVNPKTTRTREDALMWARGLVSQGIRVVRLRSTKLRRSERLAALATTRPVPR